MKIERGFHQGALSGAIWVDSGGSGGMGRTEIYDFFKEKRRGGMTWTPPDLTFSQGVVRSIPTRPTSSRRGTSSCVSDGLSTSSPHRNIRLRFHDQIERIPYLDSPGHEDSCTNASGERPRSKTHTRLSRHCGRRFCVVDVAGFEVSTEGLVGRTLRYTEKS